MKGVNTTHRCVIIIEIINSKLLKIKEEIIEIQMLFLD